MPTFAIDGHSLNLEKAYAIAHGGKIHIPQTVRNKMDESREIVSKLAKLKEPIYGVNTGFGYFAKKKIGKKKLEELQRNIILSHSGGYGDPFGVPQTRLAMVLRLNVLTKGITGVRYELCEALFKLIEKEIYPLIPEYGSVGASGDLAPLSHLALPLIGEGKVLYKGKVMPAMKALKQARLKPITLAEKEGLGLINGTQIMLAVGGLALFEALELIEQADKITALTYEGLLGRLEALDPAIHKARGQHGQIVSARNILSELEGSLLFEEGVPHNRLQDPYSVRCAPQIHGPSRDALNYAKDVVERELNAATDNPLVFPEYGEILSGGNFHGQPLAMAFDFASIALSEIASVSERRLECLVNPHISGLNAFLSPKEGLMSGYMTTQYLAASLVNENKLLANPSCTDSIPGNVGIEDHVSMGMTSARSLPKIVKNVRAVLAIEWIAAAQAVDLRKRKQLGNGTQNTYDLIREKVPTLDADRIISEDVHQAVDAIKLL